MTSFCTCTCTCTCTCAARAPLLRTTVTGALSTLAPAGAAAVVVLFAVLSFVALLPQAVEGQQAVDEVRLGSEAIELTIGGRLQTQINTTSMPGEPDWRLFFRRARLEVSVRLNDRISGTIQPDFAGGGASLTDAYLLMSLSPGIEILAGRTYRPFGLLERTSSKRILPVERGLRIRGVDGGDEYALLSRLGYSNRDLGIQLMGEPEGAPLGLSYAVGLFRGPLHGAVGDEDSFQGVARVAVRPRENLRLGAAWSGRDFAEPLGGGAWDLRRGHAFEVDVEYGAFVPGFHLLAELSGGDLDPFGDRTFWGAHAWLGYRTEESGPFDLAVEPVLRFSTAETSGSPAPGEPLAGGTLVTPGINIYFDPLNRVMVNYDVWRGENDVDAESLKIMFQLGF